MIFCCHYVVVKAHLDLDTKTVGLRKDKITFWLKIAGHHKQSQKMFEQLLKMTLFCQLKWILVCCLAAVTPPPSHLPSNDKAHSYTWKINNVTLICILEALTWYIWNWWVVCRNVQWKHFILAAGLTYCATVMFKHNMLCCNGLL